IGESFLFEGKIQDKPGAKDIIAPSYERYSGDISNQTHIGKLTPYYNETEGVSSKWLRSRIDTLKNEISELIADEIPKDIYSEEELLPRPDALYKVHFPTNLSDIEKGRERLGFEEMLSVAIKIELEKMEHEKKKAKAITTPFS